MPNPNIISTDQHKWNVEALLVSVLSSSMTPPGMVALGYDNISTPNVTYYGWYIPSDPVPALGDRAFALMVEDMTLGYPMYYFCDGDRLADNIWNNRVALWGAGVFTLLRSF